MKFTIEKSALVNDGKKLRTVIARKTTIPILTNVWIEAKDGLHLRGTDLDREVSLQARADVAAAGVVTVCADTLFGFVQKLSDGVHLVIETDGNNLIAKAGRARITLPTLPASDFPDMSASSDDGHRFTVNHSELLRLFDFPAFAISTEETRYYLNGVYLHKREGLVSVATDGHRLARVTVDAPEGADALVGVIVPRSTASDILRLADDKPVTFRITASKIVASFEDGTILTSKLIDGTFPDYQRVIPEGNTKVATLDREVLAQAVARVSTVSSEKGRAVKLSFAPGTLTLSVTNPDAGTATEELECDYSNTPLDIGFNSTYLADILAQFNSQSIRLSLSDPGSPTLFEAIGDDRALCVLMPMRA